MNTGRKPRLTQEEIDTIADLLDRGVVGPEICRITGRSESSITKVRKMLGYPARHTGERWEEEKAYLLHKYWHWVTPKKERKTNFRTPYNYERRKKG